jgi:negative regulator of flagellin synthesis FlgM
MKIGPLENKPVAAPSATERKADGGKAASATDGRTASAGASARVELSATATALAGQAVGEASFDQAKVDRISQAIRDGQFQVNADVIADKLIANAQDVLGKTGA